MRYIINGADFQSGGTFNKINEWFHVAVTYDAGDVFLYNNGSLEEDWSGLYGNTINNNYQTLSLGNSNNDSRPWDGQLDEIRISTTPRDSDWIQTSFNTMQYPAKFIKFSPQQSITSNQIELTITLQNSGKTTLNIDDFSMLFNGKICLVTCQDIYLLPDTNTTCTITGSVTGYDRIKVISAEGISDYYIYEN